jgi:anti-sigma B factor antagonist
VRDLFIGSSQTANTLPARFGADTGTESRLRGEVSMLVNGSLEDAVGPGCGGVTAALRRFGREEKHVIKHRAARPDGFSIEIEPSCGQVRVRVRGELDVAVAPQLEAVVEQACRTDRLVILDLSGLQFIDATALGLLMRAAETTSRTGAELALLPSPAVWRLLSLCALDDRFRFVPEAAAD